MNIRFENVDFSSSKPLYLQVTEIIEQKIRNKKLVVGQKLPQQADLHKIFKVSKHTVEGAISVLVEKGYLSSRRKHGTYVVSSEPKKGIDLKRKHGICFVICTTSFSNPTFRSTIFQSMLTAIEKEIKECNQYLIYNTLGEDERELSVAGKEKDVAGLIVTGITTQKHLKVIKKSNIPFVLVGDLYQNTVINEDVDIITSDDYGSVYQVTGSLIDLGHKRILYFTDSLGRYSWETKKLKGYKDAHREAGIACDENLQIETGMWDFNAAYTVMKDFLNKSIHSASAQDGERKVEPISFTAMVCTGNVLMQGVKKAFKEKGIKIPEDVSVVSGSSHEFTSYAASYKELGKEAFKRLIYRLTSPDWKAERIVMPLRFFDHDSTRRLEKSKRNKNKNSREV
jgi:DNA-binding LacI/PurR family transcriptional regulator